MSDVKSKMSIEELASAVSGALENSPANSFVDKRYSNDISVRRIRDYVSKGIIEHPIKDGRQSYFTPDHYDALLNVRKLQSEGLSDSVLRKLSDTTYGSASALSMEPLSEAPATFGGVRSSSLNNPSMSSMEYLTGSLMASSSFNDSLLANDEVTPIATANSSMTDESRSALDLLRGMSNRKDRLLENINTDSPYSLVEEAKIRDIQSRSLQGMADISHSMSSKIWTEITLNPPRNTIFLKSSEIDFKNMSDIEKSVVLQNISRLFGATPRSK